MRIIHIETRVLVTLWLCIGVVSTNETWASYITSILHSTVPTTHNNLATVITQQIFQIHRAIVHCLTQDGNSYRYPPVFDMTKSPCGVIHTVTPPVESITWNISVHNPFYINITLTRINLTDSVGECRIESLQLVWGEGLHSERFCGVWLPYNKHIDGGRVNVIYTTEGDSRQGLFSILYQVLPKSNIFLASNAFINLEEDIHGLETYATYLWSIKINGFVRYFYVDITNLFSKRFSDEFTVRVLPSFVIELLINANASIVSASTGLQCHDGPSRVSPLLPVASLIYWDPSRKFSTGSALESTAFVMTCKLNHMFGICDQCNATRIRHTRYPNQHMTQINVTSFTVLRLPDSELCNGNMCLLNLTTRSETAVIFNLTELTLPNVDHSRDCLYEGLAIYEARKHDLYYLDRYRSAYTCMSGQVTPIVRICGKVRQKIAVGTKADYLFDRVVSKGNSLLVVFYSYHRALAMGTLHFTSDASPCQGFYAFCGQVTETFQHSSIYNNRKEYFDSLRPLTLLRFYKDIEINGSHSSDILILERDAYMGVTTNASHTYNVVAVRPTSCAVIQYFPRKVYPTGRARECTISMIRARDTGSGELNITVDHLSEYSKQCTQLPPALRIDRQWTLLLADRASRSYVLNNLYPLCSQITASLAQPILSVSDLLQSRHTKVTKQYIEYTFLGKNKQLHKYSHSLNHAILINTSDPLGQFGIGHVRSIENADSRFCKVPSGHQQLQTVIVFWTQLCTIHVSINLVYEYSVSSIKQTNQIYFFHFTTRLQPLANVTFTQCFLYFRRYVILKIHKIVSHKSAICKIKFYIDTQRQFGMLQVLEELYWTEINVSIPVPLSHIKQVYIAWGYTSLSWNEANAKCSAMGGYLPSVTTKDEIDFLEKAVWGKFTPRQLVIHPCRASPVVCTFFMGFNIRLVSLNPH